MAQRAPVRAGDEYVITKSYRTSEETSDGSSSSSSRGRDDLLERVVAVRASGLELEYDLPREATAEDRARSWQFPVRVVKPVNGPMQLLNEAELQARIDLWLKQAGWTREVCGRWIFTWNAFQISCDPKSVLKVLNEVDLRSITLQEGAAHRAPEALGAGILTRKVHEDGQYAYTAVLNIDPEAVRRARAESDVAVGEIMQKPVTLEAALQERRNESISGTISLTFDTESSGRVWRRTKVTKVVTQKRDGLSESRTATEVIERRPATTGQPGG